MPIEMNQREMDTPRITNADYRETRKGQNPEPDIEKRGPTMYGDYGVGYGLWGRVIGAGTWCLD